MSKATPIACTPTVNIKQQWIINLDHTYLKNVLPLQHKSQDDYVLFRIDKLEAEHLMTSNAHYYGNVAYGYIIQTTKKKQQDYLRVRDIPKDQTNARRLQVMLTTKTGTDLPEQSPELYPSGATVLCATNLKSFNHIQPGDWVYLRPDPDRIDVNTTPQENWIYTQDPWPVHVQVVDVHSLKFCVHRKRINVEFQTGHKIRYALEGSILKHKYIASPLSRDAGLHIAPGPVSKEKQVQCYSSQRMHVTTNMPVVENQDFKIGNIAIHISEKTTTGFYGYKLMETN